MHHNYLTLPLENPVLIFSVVLFIILAAPLLLSRLRIPPIIGLIIAGALIGPYGFNLLLRSSGIVLFGTVGLLYIMFLAGLEIDMADFKRNKYKSMLFAAFTFFTPLILGFLAGYFLLGYQISSSILLASMFASYTLIAYPIASRYGIIKNRAVNITVGGIVITDTLTLLILAVIVGMEKGEVGQEFWLRLAISLVIFSGIVLVLIPMVARWFFKVQQDPITQYIFVLGVVFLSAFLAELAGIEAIIGAFLAGLALNRLIPHTSALMNRIEFVGNALFIPFFLIGIGMLIDFRIFISGTGALKVAAVMTITAVGAKFLAAYFGKLSFKFSRDEFLVMFGLSNAHAAATLAAVLVGYNIVIGTAADGTPVRLLNDDVLNGTIVMILITCTISTLVVNKAAARIALLEQESETEPDENKVVTTRFLIPVSNAKNIEQLINFSALLKKNKNDVEYHALFVRSNDDAESKGRKLLEKAQKAAAAIDIKINPISRYDTTPASGILNAIKEQNITDIVLGMHKKNTFEQTYTGSMLEQVINNSANMVFIIKPVQPVNTLKKLVVVMPQHLEQEPGFISLLQRIQALSLELKSPVIFYANPVTLDHTEKLMDTLQHNLPVTYQVLDDWNDFLIISRDLETDDLLVIVNARKSSVSYNRQLDRLPKQVSRYFALNNVLLVYPSRQNGLPASGNVPNLTTGRLDSLGSYFKKMMG